ncbi:unnamed protein product [Caretta caretta]
MPRPSLGHRRAPPGLLPLPWALAQNHAGPLVPSAMNKLGSGSADASLAQFFPCPPRLWYLGPKHGQGAQFCLPPISPRKASVPDQVGLSLLVAHQIAMGVQILNTPPPPPWVL